MEPFVLFLIAVDVFGWFVSERAVFLWALGANCVAFYVLQKASALRKK